MRDGYRTEDTWILFLAACSLSFLLDLLECRGMCLYISTYILYIHGCLYMLIYVSLPFKSSEMFLEQSNTHLCTYYPDIFFQLQTSEDATETICPIELKIFPTWTFAGEKKSDPWHLVSFSWFELRIHHFCSPCLLHKKIKCLFSERSKGCLLDFSTYHILLWKGFCLYAFTESIMGILRLVSRALRAALLNPMCVSSKSNIN